VSYESKFKENSHHKRETSEGVRLQLLMLMLMLMLMW
jgi:hypothetical protein